MAIDRTGALSNVKRHDYLPYGEELYAGMGSRTSQQGYVADNLRQKFTGYEHDAETNLEFARARYYSSSCGRFTSPDPYSGSMSLTDPQSVNRYSYVSNNPVNSTDPSGMSQRPAMVGGGMDGGGISAMFRSSSDDYTAEGETEYEQNLSDTRKAIEQADTLNQQLRDGEITEREAREKIKDNPMLGMVVTQNKAGAQNGVEVPNSANPGYNCMGWMLGYNDRNIYPTPPSSGANGIIIEYADNTPSGQKGPQSITTPDPVKPGEIPKLVGVGAKWVSPSQGCPSDSYKGLVYENSAHPELWHAFRKDPGATTWTSKLGAL